jgi:hypothetical protein
MAPRRITKFHAKQGLLTIFGAEFADQSDMPEK